MLHFQVPPRRAGGDRRTAGAGRGGAGHLRPLDRALSGRCQRIPPAAPAEAAECRLPFRHRQSRPRHPLPRHSRRARRAEGGAGRGRPVDGDRRTAGLIAGYGRGLLPEAIMRITDVFLALPQLILALALAQLWPLGRKRDVGADADLLARISPASSMPRRSGCGMRCSSMRCRASAPAHPHPAAAYPAEHPPPIIVRATIGLGFTILVPASGLPWHAAPRRPIRTGGWPWRKAARTCRRPGGSATFPGLAILLAVLGFNLLGDGLRDLVDPRPAAASMAVKPSPFPTCAWRSAATKAWRVSSTTSRCGSSGRILGVVARAAAASHPDPRHPRHPAAGFRDRCGRDPVRRDLLAFSEAELNRAVRGSRISFIPKIPISRSTRFTSVRNCWRRCAGTPGGAPQPSRPAAEFAPRRALSDPEAALGTGTRTGSPAASGSGC